MNYLEICRFLARFCYAFAALLLLPLAVAIYYDYTTPTLYPPSTPAFAYTLLGTLLSALLLSYFSRQAKGILYRRESLLLMALIWLLAPFISMFPFLISNTLQRPTLAYFETVSALTTTGSTVLCPKKYRDDKEVPYRDLDYGDLGAYYTYFGTVKPLRNPQGEIIAEGIEAVAPPLLFWRSFLNWIGGLGIVVIFSAILPALGMGGKVFLLAEMTGPIKTSMAPRTVETAKHLWKIYLILSVLLFFLLKITNQQLPLFDTFCLTFSTISTGGMSVKNGNMASYANATTECVVMLFMFAGSVNFNLFYFFFKRKFSKLFNPELLVFLAFIFFSGLFLSYQLYGFTKASLIAETGGSYSIPEALRYGFFQALSAQSSSGFATADYDRWPYVAQTLLLILSFIGGMSGSTCGGIKVMRYLMLFKIVRNKIELLFRPATIRQLRIGKEEVGQEAGQMVFCFFAAYLAITVAAIFLLCLDHVDPETALGLVSATLNNSGIGFREAGPTFSCAFLSPFGALLSSFLMLLGRLELFAILVILVPAFWKQAE